ncbi:hypothetical protein Taro_015239 [Colocasia esculenta]|uniref:PPPDE domain-containing protein n=1 Tax=Colocasia esculenta TaxID=4460 RepID=A0A843UKC4_COLES|nr:hypothetical protein [Colocasia esculenta]
MKTSSKKGWKSGIPFRLKGTSATRFCMFPKVRAAGQTPGNTPVYLNVYDLTPMNGYVYWAGIGVFHSGVEVHGVEYAFGAHDYSTSGVFEVEPRQWSLCNFLLPDALRASAVPNEPDYQNNDGEKKRLRSAFSCLSSISMRQKQLTETSVYIHSPKKGCFPPWEFRWSCKPALKER